MLSQLQNFKGQFGLGIEIDKYTNAKYLKDFRETDYYSQTNNKTKEEQMSIRINEYSVDNIKWFKEHEGLDAFSCDILYGNEKIGTFSEDYMNGPDNYTFDNDFETEISKIRNAAKNFFNHYSTESYDENVEDFFIRFLRNLKEANEQLNEEQKIIINTTYPYDYEIKDRNNLTDILLRDENKLEIPFMPVIVNANSKEEKDDENELS